MSKLTRQQIEEYRKPTKPAPPGRVDAICDMALCALDYEARIHDLEATLRRLESALQNIIDATPAHQHQQWPHHHWYLATAREALTAKPREDKCNIST